MKSSGIKKPEPRRGGRLEKEDKSFGGIPIDKDDSDSKEIMPQTRENLETPAKTTIVDGSP